MVNFVTSQGATKAFGILAGLTAAGFTVVPLLQMFGARFRQISGHVPHPVPAYTYTLGALQTHDNLQDVTGTRDVELEVREEDKKLSNIDGL